MSCRTRRGKKRRKRSLPERSCRRMGYGQCGNLWQFDIRRFFGYRLVSRLGGTRCAWFGLQWRSRHLSLALRCWLGLALQWRQLLAATCVFRRSSALHAVRWAPSKSKTSVKSLWWRHRGAYWIKLPHDMRTGRELTNCLRSAGTVLHGPAFFFGKYPGKDIRYICQLSGPDHSS